MIFIVVVKILAELIHSWKSGKINCIFEG